MFYKGGRRGWGEFLISWRINCMKGRRICKMRRIKASNWKIKFSCLYVKGFFVTRRVGFLSILNFWVRYIKILLKGIYLRHFFVFGFCFCIIFLFGWTIFWNFCHKKSTYKELIIWKILKKILMHYKINMILLWRKSNKLIKN